MAQCGNCGMMNPDGANFCCNCRGRLNGGAKISWQQNRTSAVQQPVNRYSAGGRTSFSGNAARTAGKSAAKAGGGFIKKILTVAVIGFVGVNAVNYIGGIEDNPGGGTTTSIVSNPGGGGNTGGGTGGYTGGYDWDDGSGGSGNGSGGVYSNQFTPFLSVIQNGNGNVPTTQNPDGYVNMGEVSQATLEYWIIAEGQARVNEIILEQLIVNGGSITLSNGKTYTADSDITVSHISFKDNKTMTKAEFEKQVRDYAIKNGIADGQKMAQWYDAKYGR